VERTVLHVDMDAFYVSVELRRRPDLIGLPVVVGGTGGRGVVAAASYEARRYGIHSAMPSVTARRRCPAAVFLPGDMALYEQVSAQVRSIFDRFTPCVEPLSLDEAFLDVTSSIRLFGSGPEIGHQIRVAVQSELGLTCSVGVATNKFLAKLASVAAKPTATRDGILPGVGVMEVEAGKELEFLHPLPVNRLWGVGPVTLELLNDLGVATVADLAAMDQRTLIAKLGPAAGTHLAALARGVDHRRVESDRDVKSIGHEETFAEDLHDADQLHHELVRLADAVSSRLRARRIGARTVTLKIKFADFQTITRSVTSRSPTATAPGMVSALGPLLAAVDNARGIRLLGVSGSNFAAPAEQLSLLDTQVEDAGRAAVAIDEIRDRFGSAAIGPASTVTGRVPGRKTGPLQPGSQHWGPNQPPDLPSENRTDTSR
jgi:DNA polymerase-4